MGSGEQVEYLIDLQLGALILLGPGPAAREVYLCEQERDVSVARVVI